MITAWVAMVAARMVRRTSGSSKPRGARLKKGLAAARRIGEDQGPLPQIIEHQGGQDEEEPAVADRPAAEAAHLRVERLGAGHRQHHRAERQEGQPGLGGEEAEGVARIDRRRHFGMPGERERAEQADGQQIDGDDRPEPAAEPHRAALRPTNRPTRIPAASGSTSGASRGSTTASPSTAASTEMAGVTIESP